MKVASQDIKVAGRGISSSSQFTVANNSKVMELLSNALYKNKIKAVIRELLTNAYDAHKEAGTAGTKQAILTLPEYINPVFGVRDFGTGLSFEQLNTLYRTYGESTKIHSNEYNGCMGIGSKAPFAYTTTFTVISYHNGTKHTCILTKDRTGMPSINFLDSEDTYEENGLEVTFAVKEQDVYRFLDEAKNVMRPFPDEFSPIVTHSNWPGNKNYPDIVLKGDDWFVLSDCVPGYRQSVARMGYVEYPIDVEHFYDETKEDTKYGREASSLWNSRYSSTPSGKLDNKYTRALNPGKLVMDFDIGDVEMDISREGLQYNDRTIKSIKNKLDSVLKSAKEKIDNEIKSCKNIWEAERNYSKMSGIHRIFTTEDIKPEWNNIELNHANISLTCKDITDKYEIYDCSLTYGGMLSKNTSYSVNMNRYYEVVWADKKTGVYSRVKQAMLDGKLGKGTPYDTSDYNVDVLVVKPKQDNIKIDDFIKHIKFPFGYTNASDYPAPKPTNKNKTHSSKVFKLVDKSPNGILSSSWWNIAEVDVENDSGNYLVIDRFEINGKSPSDLRDLIDLATKLGVTVPDFVAVKVAKSDEFEKSKKWKQFFGVFDDAICNWLNTSSTLSDYYDYMAYNSISSKESNQISAIREILEDRKNSDIDKLIKEYDNILSNYHSMNKGDFLSFLRKCGSFGITINTDPQKEEEARNKVPGLLEKLYNKYPMLMYYLYAYNDIWQRNSFGLPSREQVKKECISYVSSV